MIKSKIVLTLAIFIFIVSCQKQDVTKLADPYAAIKATFGTKIDPTNLLNYANQSKPTYITQDNSVTNPITNEKATLGRVLFYDKNLSVNNTISCGSCHKQEFAFSDTALASSGVLGGFSSRHTMRLINTRFSEEVKFFWDERAISLEAQTTRPIQDHAEMGFSGQNGRQNINDLIIKLSAINYYQELFKFVYGTPTITEQKMQDCLASFVRSIQSYDSKFDLGRANAPNNENPFTNFTTQENLGKQLFIQPPQFDNLGNRIGGGIGCQGCHRAPEFDIDPNSKNNGMIKNLVVGGSVELAITKSPSLRDAVNATGGSNGPFMHSGVHASLQAVIGHYNNVNQVPANNNLDARLSPKGTGQNLNMTPAEISAVVAFIKTLSGTNVYKDTKWSSPF
jgi:cytochrome c peroxidase